jgi:hypothetical protein
MRQVDDLTHLHRTLTSLIEQYIPGVWVALDEAQEICDYSFGFQKFQEDENLGFQPDPQRYFFLNPLFANISVGHYYILWQCIPCLLHANELSWALE